MLNRLKVLINLQLDKKNKFNTLDSTKKKVAHIFVRLLLAVIITAVCYFGLFFFQSIMSLNVNQSLLLFVIGFTQIISIIAAMLSLTNQLYLSKDNAILFNFPVKTNEIFISKLIVFYIKEFNKNLYFILPIMIAFGMYLGLSVGYVINLLLLIVVLPLFPILIGAILSLGWALLKKLFASFPYVKFASIVVAVLGMWLLIAHLLSMMPVPLRLIEIYTTFMQWVNNIILDFNSVLLFYNNLIEILFVSRSIVDYLVILGTLAVLVAVVYLISMPFYFKVYSTLKETHRKKKTRSVSRNKPMTTFKAFLLKEFRGLYRDTDKLTEYAINIISFPFVIYVMNTIFTAINTNTLGDTLVIGFNIIIGLMLLVSANTISATALSSEGGEFGLLKTVPTKTSSIIWAKLCFNVIISTCTIILGVVELLFITEIGILELILLLLALIFINTSHIVWSIQLDLLNPQFKAYDNNKNTSNPNVAKSVLLGVILSFAFGAFAIFFMNFDYVAGWIDLIAVSLLFLIFRIYLLILNMKVYFKRLEL